MANLAGYVTPNTTTISNIATLSGTKDLNYILGINSLPFSTPTSHRVQANSILQVGFTCSCTANGTDVSDNRLPLYTVKPDDGLHHIATDLFSRLVKYEDIQMANNTKNVSKIEIERR